MELFLKIVSPIQSYDFQTFSHNLLLTLPASSLIGLILFFVLGAFVGFKSQEQRIYIVGATTIVISFTAAFYNLGVPLETLISVYSEWFSLTNPVTFAHPSKSFDWFLVSCCHDQSSSNLAYFLFHVCDPFPRKR